MSARWIGWPLWRADSEVYTINFCHSERPCSSVPGRACGRSSSSPSRLQTRTRSTVISGRRIRPPNSGSTRADGMILA